MLPDILKNATELKDRVRLRSQAVLAPMMRDWARSGGEVIIERTIGENTLRIALEDAPQKIVDEAGNEIGVEVRVSASLNGKRLAIDPHRRFINPPVMVHDGGFEPFVDEAGLDQQRPTFTYNPREALRQCILESVFSHPRIRL